MDRREAHAWLAFLLKCQPHKRVELLHRYTQLDASRKAMQAAIKRLEELAMQYPEEYLVFKTKQRLLGK